MSIHHTREVKAKSKAFKRLCCVKFKYRCRCHWCGKSLCRRTATVDHVVSLAEGGSGDRENLVMACQRCNNERSKVTGQLFRRIT